MYASLSALFLAPFIAVMAVTGTPAAPPDLTGIAALITAGIGIVGFLATIFRGRQNNKRVQEVEQAASYVKGFDSLIKRLEVEMKQLRKDHESERMKWITERESLERTINNLRTDLRTQTAKNYETRGLLQELRGQIKGFLNAQQYEEFQKHLR